MLGADSCGRVCGATLSYTHEESPLTHDIVLSPFKPTWGAEKQQGLLGGKKKSLHNGISEELNTMKHYWSALGLVLCKWRSCLISEVLLIPQAGHQNHLFKTKPSTGILRATLVTWDLHLHFTAESKPKYYRTGTLVCSEKYMCHPIMRATKGNQDKKGG